MLLSDLERQYELRLYQTHCLHVLSTSSRGANETLLSDLAYTMSQDDLLDGFDDVL